MEHLTPLDASFLQAEDSDPHVSIVIGGVVILDGPAPSHDEFMSSVAARLAAVPHARQIVRGFPFDLGAPVWADDPNFDLARHIRRTALPAPGDDAALYRLVERVMAPRFDREHAMWECWVVEGLADGRWAILSKMHHCMADGMSGARVIESMCDFEDDGPGPAIRPTTAAVPPPLPRRLADLVGLALSPRRLLEFITTNTVSPTWLARTSMRAARGVLEFANELLSGSSTRVLNGPVGRRRAYSAAKVSMADIRLIHESFAVTVNDVALAVIAGALRKTLFRHGETPSADSARTLVPVSVRVDDDLQNIGNRVSLMVPFLPVDIEDPVARLEAVGRRLTAHKASGETEAGHAITAIAERWPFAPVAWTVRLATRLPQRVIVAVTTNVPGPRRPRKVLGRRIIDILPFAPIALRLRVSIAIFSYADRLTFGIDTDFDALPEADEIATSIEQEVAALAKAAIARAPG